MLTEEKTMATGPIAETSEIVRPMPPEPGEVLDGRFLILELLSEGGTFRVLKATDLERGDLVAIKVPKEHFAEDEEFLERFRREEEIGLSVRHPYLARAREVRSKSRPYLVLEYAPGEPLDARLAAVGALREHEALHIAGMVLEALAELHARKVVHGDVTPRNILVCRDGTVRLLDLGNASFEGGPDVELQSIPSYAAPERLLNRPGDARSDLYSLGVVLFEMLTGKLPGSGEHPAEVLDARLALPPMLPPEFGADLRRILARALALTPDERFGTAMEMKEALEGLMEWPSGGRASQAPMARSRQLSG